MLTPPAGRRREGKVDHPRAGLAPPPGHGPLARGDPLDRDHLPALPGANPALAGPGVLPGVRRRPGELSMGYVKTKKISSWRRFAMATWRAPDDPTIYGSMQFEVTRPLARIKSIREKTGVKVTLATILGQGLARGLRETPDC